MQGMKLEHVSCNLCGKTNAASYAAVSYMDYLSRRPELKRDDDPLLKNGEAANYKFSLVKCKNCGLIYVNPRLTRKNLTELYQGEYFSYYGDTESEAHKKRQETFKIEIAELEGLAQKLKTGRKILDVGCGGGFFLAGLDKSWEKYGIEVNPSAVKYGQDTFGLNILKRDIGKIDFPEETFDVIKMRGVIEHLPDPMKELREACRILRKGGLIAINTPNIGSICGKIYKEKFRIVCPIYHIYYFSTRTLSLMLKIAGFKIQKVSYHYFDTPYASWRDPLKILFDRTVSPAFYGNIVDIYAVKGG